MPFQFNKHCTVTFRAPAYNVWIPTFNNGGRNNKTCQSAPSAIWFFFSIVYDFIHKQTCQAYQNSVSQHLPSLFMTHFRFFYHFLLENEYHLLLHSTIQRIFSTDKFGYLFLFSTLFFGHITSSTFKSPIHIQTTFPTSFPSS